MLKQATIEDALALLKELNAADPEMMRNFIGTRFRANDETAKHPTVQVASVEGRGHYIGLLGVLNGLFSHDKKYLAMEPTYVCPFNREHKLEEGKSQCPECRAQIYLEKIDFGIIELETS